MFALVQAVNSDHILKFGDCQVRVLGTNTTLAERTMFFNPINNAARPRSLYITQIIKIFKLVKLPEALFHCFTSISKKQGACLKI